jgi:ribosomal protein L22
VAAVETPKPVRAQAKWVRTSARKARLVAEHIRGRSVPEARTVLAFTQRAAARDIEKVLRSAVANAEANHGLLGDDLFVQSIMIDEGPTLKRWRARARGRVARIKKRTCHITLELAPSKEGVQRAQRTLATAAAVEAPPAEKPTSAPKAAPAEEKPKRSRKPKAEADAASEPKPRRRAKRALGAADQSKPTRRTKAED